MSTEDRDEVRATIACTRKDAAALIRRSGEDAAINLLETYTHLYQSGGTDPLGIMAAFAALGLASALEEYYAEEAAAENARNN